MLRFAQSSRPDQSQNPAQPLRGLFTGKPRGPVFCDFLLKAFDIELQMLYLPPLVTFRRVLSRKFCKFRKTSQSVEMVSAAAPHVFASILFAEICAHDPFGATRVTRGQATASERGAL